MDAKLAVVTPALAAPSPSRSSSSDRAAERIAKAKALLKAARHDKKAAADRIALIAGRAFLAEMSRSHDFRRQAVEVLRRTVIRPTDRAEIAPLLVPTSCTAPD